MYRESILVSQLLHKLPSTWRGQLPLLHHFFLAATLINFFGLLPGHRPMGPHDHTTSRPHAHRRKLTLNRQLESYLIK